MVATTEMAAHFSRVRRGHFAARVAFSTSPITSY